MVCLRPRKHGQGHGMSGTPVNPRYDLSKCPAGSSWCRAWCGHLLGSLGVAMVALSAVRTCQSMEMGQSEAELVMQESTAG